MAKMFRLCKITLDKPKRIWYTCNMKLTKNDLDRMARKISDKLLCTAGLKNAKKIAGQVKRNLLAEDKRRKDLKETK